MKLTATIVGSLKADMQAELRRIERAVPDGVKAAGDGLKGSLRKQVVAAGLGARLSRTWRGKTYVNKGHDAASFVWSKAPQIALAFDKGVLIERWRHHYNTIRPHSSLGYRPPAPGAILPNVEGPTYAVDGLRLAHQLNPRQTLT